MTDRDLEGQYAGFLSRTAGLVLDWLIVAVGLIVVNLAALLLFKAFNIDLVSCQGVTSSISVAGLLCTGGRWFLIATFFLFSPLYFIIFWMLVGQTIGQRVMGVRVVRLDGHNLGFRRSLVRWIGCQICLLTFGLGFLWVLVDDRRMGWHDILARTCVLYSWRAVQKESFVGKLSGRLLRDRTGPPSVEQPQAVRAGPGLPEANPAAQEQLPR